MILRNSIKTILRTPVKTFMFGLLIAAVTGFLYLGINAWAASTAMLRDLDANSNTIVTFEYLEDYGSNKGSKSEAMLADVAGIDFDAIAANENVLLWQPSDEGMGTAAGFVANDYNAPYSNICVFIVTGLRQYAEGSPYHGRLVESLYSFRPYEPGRNVFIENQPESFDFNPDPDATYIIHADNYRIGANGLSVMLTPFYSWIAQEAGVDCAAIMPYYQIESAEAFHEDENNVYKAIAQYYEAMNNALTICRVQDMEKLEEFHQGYLQVLSGRLFTRDEGEEGARVCVISETLAKNRDLEVGDQLTIKLPDDERAALYAWGDKMSREETFTIVGIVNYHRDYHLNVYVPSQSSSARPVRYLYDLGQATIKNGTADTFLSQIKPLVSERVFITVYDQGYQTTADALKVIQSAALALSVIALAVTLTVLAFFAYLFADMQRDAVEIMRCFGTKKNQVRLYLMAGTSLISLIAIGTGILIGMRYAEGLVESAYAFVSELQTVDMRYSDGFRGITKDFTPVVTLSYALAAAVGLGVFFVSLTLCLHFAEKAISGRLIAARARVRVGRPPKRSSTALSGPLRHAVLSIGRGGVRSLLVPVLCAAALLFIASLQATLASYDEAREALYENTELSGYGAQMNGKFSDKLIIQNSQAKELVNLEHIREAAYTYTFNYVYLGIPVQADGRPGQVKPVPVPTNPYELEILNDILFSQPSIIFTDSVRNAPEFYFSEFHCEFMSGWDESRFSSRHWEKLPCILSSQFLDEHGIKLGDTIRLYTKNYISYLPVFLDMDMLVVGSYTSPTNQNNIYCPLPLGALDPDASTLKELGGRSSSISTGRYYHYTVRTLNEPDGISPDMLTQQQLVDVMLDSNYISALTFKIRDPRYLGEVKDALETAGFSGPKMVKDIRLCIVIEDAQFNETLSSIAQRSKYLEILYPVLLVLVCILGLITGFLSINSRREDIALMRGMGTQKNRIFATIFGEQLLLLFLGGLPAAVIWYVGRGGAQLAQPGVYAFFVCYALSAGLSTLYQNTKSALSILSEKE